MIHSSSLANCLRDHGHKNKTKLFGRFQIWQWGLGKRRPARKHQPPPDGSSEALLHSSGFSWLVIDSFSLVPAYTAFT